MRRNTASLLLPVLPHVVLTLIFVGEETAPLVDLWNLLIREVMFHLFIIQKTVLGYSALMNMYAYDPQLHPLALNGRIVPYGLGK